MALTANLQRAAEADIEALVAQRAAEGPHPYLKRELPRLDAAGRHELLADVCAFANGSGGDLIYGVDEDGEGCATAIRPNGRER